MVVEVIGLSARPMSANCHPERSEQRERSRRISDSFAPAKPVPVLWVGVLAGFYLFSEIQNRDTKGSVTPRNCGTGVVMQQQLTELGSWLCRVSWNPLFGSVLGSFFAGLFALLGAIIGGRYVLRSIDDQRKRERLAAGRAVSAELELNLAGTATLAVAGRAQPLGYLVSRPKLLRTAFDDRLTLMSELLKPSEFFSLASLYAQASASFALLETQAQRGVEFTPGAINSVNTRRNLL